VAHDVLLLDKPPEVFHRFRSLLRLKTQYLRWRSDGWEPDLVLVYNLSPIFNSFVRWLRRQGRCPRLVLLLLDSSELGRPVRSLKALRRRLKPMCFADAAMLDDFDACIGLSRSAEKYFRPKGIPFLWMPGGCTPTRVVREEQSLAESGEATRLTRFGYYGALGAHSGVRQLIESFLSADLAGTLDICGYGKAATEISGLAQRDRRVVFHGLLTPEQCLSFGRQCDVLVTPRPLTHGNQNNFASKLFDYALSGRAILTSRLSGVELVLGPEAFYVEADNLEPNLTEKLREIAALPPDELNRRGMAIQERILNNFSWETQGSRMADFLESVLGAVIEPARLAEAA
jgi:glycosyltransferase involved in cell wall biosynthesis